MTINVTRMQMFHIEFNEPNKSISFCIPFTIQLTIYLTA